MFKTLNIFRITAGPETGTLEGMAQAAPFTPCTATQDKSVGWVPPRGENHGALVESIGGHRIMKLMIETKSVPSATVKKKAQEAADHIKATTGRKPGKKEMKELREYALTALLPQAFPKQAAVLVWFDFSAGLLMTDASSQGKSDEVITALVRTFDGLALMPLQTKTAPQTAMTGWLSSEDAEEDAYEMHGLTIERACELRSADEEKSVVKFNRHNIVNEQVRQHISEGKLPRWVAMSWEGRIGFVLTEAMQIKKISYLEGVFDDRQDTDEDGFDADVTIFTGELSKMIPELIEAMGGEAEHGAALPGAAGAPTIYTDGQPDPLLEQARALVTAPDGKASVSYVQRKLQIGYNRAARLLEDLQNMGVINGYSGSAGANA